ncbi:MAG: hypothetical protein JWR26_2766 [Pedosphaera sp.]|nr:hypothetical protein [Pedosphaera sp.]
MLVAFAALPLVAGGMMSSESGDTPDASSQTTPALPTVPDAAQNPGLSVPPATAAPAPAVQLSAGASEIATLAQSGIGDEVMLAYINNVHSRFNLGTNQIVYLNDLGVSGTVVAAMIQRDTAIDAESALAANQAGIFPTQPAPPDENTYPAPTPPMDYTPPITAEDNGQSPDYSEAAPVDNSGTDDSGYFYDSMAPYGSWINVNGYGRCWQPTVFVGNHDWRPYCDRGRWLYSDCGWYWQSDYSWGWAAFHYGRWFRDSNHGWCWTPGRTWSPAWVSWRHSGDYCGWAPLPPSAHFSPGHGFTQNGRAVGTGFDFGLRSRRYTFIPVERMTDLTPGRYALTPEHAASIFPQTRVANNVTYEHNRIINHGIDPTLVSAASGIPVRRGEIRELPIDHNHGSLSDHVSKNGNTLVISHPQLPPPAANPPASRHPGAPAHGTVRPANPQPVVAGSTGSPSWPGAGTGTRPAVPIVTGHIAPQSPATPPPVMHLNQPNPTPRPTPPQVATTPVTHPASSLVVIGNRTVNTPALTAPRTLPNMILTGPRQSAPPVEPAQGTETGNGYYAANSETAAPWGNHQTMPNPRTETPGAISNPYFLNQNQGNARTAPAQSQAPIVVPGRFTAAQALAARSESGHTPSSAYSAVGSARSESAPAQASHSHSESYSAPAPAPAPAPSTHTSASAPQAAAAASSSESSHSSASARNR